MITKNAMKYIEKLNEWKLIKHRTKHKGNRKSSKMKLHVIEKSKKNITQISMEQPRTSQNIS